MMLDTSALIAILEQEADAHIYARRIAEATIVKISAPIYLETAMVLSRRKSSDAIKKLNEFVAELGVEISAFGPDEAFTATQAFFQFGKGRGHPAQLNYGDCISYAASKAASLPLLFKGGDFSLTDVECAL